MPETSTRALIALGALLCALAAAGLALMLMFTPAWAHGPWPAVCCSDRDCAEIDAKMVREDGDTVHFTVPPGAHPMWPADGRGVFRGSIPRASLRPAVTGEWGLCISPTGALLCAFPPMSGV
jgi:hypothetical protein